MQKIQVKKRKKLALGKGLGALIPDIRAAGDMEADYFYCQVSLIRPNRYQPRKKFKEKELAALSASIKEQGIIQPLLIRRLDDGYELVAGERRLRAAKLAGYQDVPCVIKDLTEKQLLEMSVVENIQRENLNPMEESDAYHRLITEFELTQEEVAIHVGKSRSAVANFLRLRQLPESIKESIVDGALSMGHARALLGISNKAQQSAVWRAVVAKGLSVRETESLVNRLKKESGDSRKRKEGTDEIYFTNISEELSRNFGTKVKIRRRGQKGKVEIEFYSNEDLDRLLHLLNQV
ncbi:MAG: chromosome partitioning protein ParB [Deltaproteobacteria bacterium]|nr:MAG: chromosome partitioning protein ParB [Deltaproteobacteria bacterium]RLC18870.1 MAG: chromosome partitioning protein ParB [Deltaproteobacteria bacterium]